MNVTPDPIFILGITQRSGTNFLYDLIRLHPDCGGAPPWEDFLVQYSDQLEAYAESVSAHWPSNWGVTGQTLRSYLGQGLLAFLTAQVGEKRILTKTPSVQHLNNFFELFPQAHLLIIIRDGRSVVESGVRSFGWDYEAAMRRWTEAAQTILDFKRTHNHSDKYLIVRYEALHNNLADEMKKTLDFLQLNSNKYNFVAAQNLPLRGSSILKQQDEDTLHWQSIQKPTDFKPTERWSSWSPALHQRFNWIAGPQMEQFDYELQHVEAQLGLTIWQRLLDAKFRLSVSVRNLQNSIIELD